MACQNENTEFTQERERKSPPCTLKNPQVIDYISWAIKTEWRRKRSPETDTFIQTDRQRTNTDYHSSTLRPFRDQWWEEGGHSSDQQTRCRDLIVLGWNRRSRNSCLNIVNNMLTIGSTWTTTFCLFLSAVHTWGRWRSFWFWASFAAGSLSASSSRAWSPSLAGAGSAAAGAGGTGARRRRWIVK